MEQQRRMTQETALGYELDTITLRDIAAVRYVKHHEWLDHVVGSAIPTDRITPPKLEPVKDEKTLDTELEKLQKELDSLKAEKASGWISAEARQKDNFLADEITRLREDFGTGVTDDSVKKVEEFLGRKVVSQERLNPVKVTYDRQSEEQIPMEL